MSLNTSHLFTPGISLLKEGGKSKDQTHMTRYINPMRHSKDGYNPDNLETLPRITNTGQKGLEEEVPPEEGGTAVLICKIDGFGSGGLVLGQFAATERNLQKTVDGNNPMSQWLDYATNLTQGKNIKPNMVEKVVKGALVRVPEEKGQEWMHSLTKGIRSSATELPILGQYLEEFKEVPTALQKDAQIPTAGLLSSLPGEIMNIGSMLKSLTSEQLKTATKNMNGDVLDAFQSLSYLTTDTTSSGMLATTGRVNPSKFIENTVNMLSEVQSYDDLLNVMDRIRTDESVRGLEEYTNLTYTGLTANTETTANGDVYFRLSSPVSQSRIFFDDGFTMNVNNKTYTVTSATQNSKNVFVIPKITDEFVFADVFVYSPVLEFTASSTFGDFNMTMDLNGNISTTRESKKALEAAREALTGQMTSGQAGGEGQSLFDSAARKLSDMIDRIPNNGRKSLIEEIRTRAKSEIDGIVKKTLGTQYPFA